MSVPQLHKPRPNLADRPPPYNLEAERSVLGACMLDDQAADDVAMILRPDDFYRADHAETWRAIVGLRDEGEVPTGLAVIDRLERMGRYEAMGGNQFIRELIDAVPHAANAEYHARIVREKAIARKLIEGCEEILKACYSLEHTAGELVSMAERSIFAIGEREAGSNVVDMVTLVDEAMDRIERRQAGELSGLLSGFEDLDCVAGGFRPGQLVIVAARPSIGKTSLGMAFATNIGAQAKRPPLFSSLEMSRDELGDRLMSAWSEINSYRIKAIEGAAPRLDEAGWERLRDAAGRLSRVPIRVDDTPIRTVSQIAATARRIRRSDGLPAVFVDYLGLIDGEKEKGESTQEMTARVSKRLKQLGRELKVPVFALHQLNRQPESRDDRRPRLADLRDSGAIEQDADIVLLLHRPEFYDPNDKPGVAEIIVAKNRNGATATVELAFRKEWTRFDSLSQYREAAGVISDETSS